VVRTNPPPKRKKAASKGSNGNGSKNGNGGAGGRPTKFNATIRNQIIKLSNDGWTDEEIAKFVGISHVTLYGWKKNKPEFFKAIKDGKEVWDNQVVRALRERALGYSHPETKVFCNAMGEITTQEVMKHYPPDPVSMIFWLCNRQSQDWKRNLDTKMSEEKDIDWNNIGFRAAAQVNVSTDSSSNANQVEG